MAHNRRLSQFANTVGYNGGSIGLGTVSPHAKLEVSGGQNQTANQFTDLVSIAANANNDGIAAEVQLNFGISPSHTAEANRKARIQSVTHGGTVTPLLINPAGGNIGINTDTPSNLLHIDGETDQLKLSDGSGSFEFRAGNVLIIKDNSTERLRIDTAGTIKCGTSSVLKAEINNSVSGHQFISQCDDNNNGFEVYQQHGSTSSRNTFVVYDNRTGSKSPSFLVRGDGRVLIGAASARTNFNNGTASPQIQIENVANGNQSSIAMIHNENALGDSSALHFAKTRGGTIGDDSALNQAGDRLGQIVFSGHDGSEFVQAATIEGLTDATPGNNDMPGRLSFSVTHDGASSPVERMRINRKGFLKMGPRITDGSHGAADLDSVRHEFTSDDNGWTMYVQHTSGSASEAEGILIRYRTTSPNGTANSFIQGQDSNTARFRFASNGGLYNYQSNDSNLCDEREKKNIVSLDSKWDKVKSWDLKKFHYNEDDDGDDLRYGVIAQQVEEHCPEVVSDWVKRQAESAVLDEDGNVVTPAVPEIIRKGVKEQQMMWMAIKALQEAQTRIETLEAQVAALQGS